MLAFLGGKFLSPLPGLGVHGGTEPSAHALGYHLAALRAWGHGWDYGCVVRFRVVGVLRGELPIIACLPGFGSRQNAPFYGCVTRTTWGYALPSVRDDGEVRFTPSRRAHRGWSDEGYSNLGGLGVSV